MKICLSSVADTNWMAGVYYLTSLIRALRSLPVSEQPEIMLLASSHTADLYCNEGIQSLVDLSVTDAAKDNSSNSSLRGLLRRFLRSGVETLDSRGGLKASIQRYTDRSLEKMLRQERVSLIYPWFRSLGREFGVPWLPWIPDLQHRYYPHFFSHAELKRRDVNFARLGHDAQRIVLSSRACLDDFDRFFPGNRDKLRVLNFRTVSDVAWFENARLATLSEYGLPDCYFMIPNQFWVHKNHRVAFEAVKILTDRGFEMNVVCTGSTADYRKPDHFGQLMDYAKASGIVSRIRLLGFIPRGVQIQIMRRSMALIQPSLFEGWSTVVEDARTLGKRVFLSDIAVHREQALPGAVLFDPSNAEALADSISSEWNNLSPGPSPDAEQVALERQKKLVLSYAYNFLAVAQELLDSWNGGSGPCESW
jgi:glycosyltransferase involved in cell wall biosynthesis